MKYFSMFSGIGGFELGIQRAFNNRHDLRNGIESIPKNSADIKESQVRAECIGYSEIDKYAIKVYERNFNDRRNKGWGKQSIKERQQTSEHELHPESIISTPHNTGGHKNYGDATAIKPEELPDFDLLVGGFPCQAFSIAGKRKGFDDTRGTLFFDIARILSEKKPKHLVLENVKGLLSHEQGRTFQTIIGVLSDLGYGVEWQVLNSKDFGVPQNRERIIIVGHLGNECGRKVFPLGSTNDSHIKLTTQSRQQQDRTISPDGISPCLASNTTFDKWNVDYSTHIRRLTPKECERLQGFPDDWTKYGEDEHGMIVNISDTQRYKMCGNAVTTNVIQAVIERLL